MGPAVTQTSTGVEVQVVLGEVDGAAAADEGEGEAGGDGVDGLVDFEGAEEVEAGDPGSGELDGEGVGDGGGGKRLEDGSETVPERWRRALGFDGWAEEESRLRRGPLPPPSPPGPLSHRPPSPGEGETWSQGGGGDDGHQGSSVSTRVMRRGSRMAVSVAAGLVFGGGDHGEEGDDLDDEARSRAAGR